jgi:Domain of unknown function (DUF4190)
MDQPDPHGSPADPDALWGPPSPGSAVPAQPAGPAQGQPVWGQQAQQPAQPVRGQQQGQPAAWGLEGQPPASYPPPGYGGYPPPGYGYPVRQAATNGLAVASMVLGIVWIYWIGSVLALVFGYIARRQIRERDESGGGMAVAGIVLGWVGIAFLVLFVGALTW